MDPSHSPVMKSFKDGDFDSPYAAQELDARLKEEKRLKLRKRRFCHFAFLTFVMAFYGWATWWRGEEEPLVPWFRCGGLQASDPSYIPIPCGITLEKCTRWDGHDEDNTSVASFAKPPRRILNQHPVSSYAEFTFPTNSSKLFFISRGGYSHGSFGVDTGDAEAETHDDGSATDLKVRVEMSYQDERFLDLARVCKVTRKGADGLKEYGVGIFTPEIAGCRPHRRRDNPYFKTTVYIPGGVKAPEIEEDLPLFGLEDALVGRPAEGRLVDVGKIIP